MEGAGAQAPFLIRIEVRIARDVLVGGEQEAARAASGIADRVPGRRLHHVDDCLDQRPRREVLAGARLRVLGVLLEQALVGRPFDVSIEGHPALGVDQVDDQPAELRRILDPVLGFAEDDAEHARVLPELREDVAVVHLELVAVEGEQRGPVEPRGDDGRARERRSRLLVRHLQEEEERELLDVVAVGEPVVFQDVAVAPELLDESRGVGHGSIWCAK